MNSFTFEIEYETLECGKLLPQKLIIMIKYSDFKEKPSQIVNT